jgi:hypothetical protein
MWRGDAWFPSPALGKEPSPADVDLEQDLAAAKAQIDHLNGLLMKAQENAAQAHAERDAALARVAGLEQAARDAALAKADAEAAAAELTKERDQARGLAEQYRIKLADDGKKAKAA